MSSKLILEKIKWLLDIWDYNTSVCLRVMLKYSFKRVIFTSYKRHYSKIHGLRIWRVDKQGWARALEPAGPIKINACKFIGIPSSMRPSKRRWSVYHGHWVGKKVGMNFHAPLYLHPPQPFLLCGQWDYLKNAREEVLKVSLSSQSQVNLAGS